MSKSSTFLRVVAFVGVVAQFYFAYQEIFNWGREFVADAAPAWVDGQEAAAMPADLIARIDWAAPLAVNLGVYNLVLAIGLAWVALAGSAVARTLGVFVAAWLILAAVAAGFTHVYLAMAAQGILGLLLLEGCRRASSRLAPGGVLP
jgi:uncharacterized membrane protein